MQSNSNVLHSRKNNIANVTKLPNKKVAAANRDGTKKYGILLRSRVDILCCKFIENIKNRIYEKKGIKIGGDKKMQNKKISFFTEMINIEDDMFLKNETEEKETVLDIANENVIDDLEKYVASLDLENDVENVHENEDVKTMNNFDMEVSQKILIIPSNCYLISFKLAIIGQKTRVLLEFILLKA